MLEAVVLPRGLGEHLVERNGVVGPVVGRDCAPEGQELARDLLSDLG